MFVLLSARRTLGRGSGTRIATRKWPALPASRTSGSTAIPKLGQHGQHGPTVPSGQRQRPSICWLPIWILRAWDLDVLVGIGLVAQLHLEPLVLFREVELLPVLPLLLGASVLDVDGHLEELRQPPRAQPHHCE